MSKDKGKDGDSQIKESGQKKNFRELVRQDTLKELDIENNPREEYREGNDSKYVGAGDQGEIYVATSASRGEVGLKIPISGYDDYNNMQLSEYAMKKAMRKVLEDKKDPDVERVNEVYDIAKSTKQFKDGQDQPTVDFTMELAKEGTAADLENNNSDLYKQETEQVRKLVGRLDKLGFEMGEDIMKDDNLFLKGDKLQIGDCGGVKVDKGSTAERYFKAELEVACEKTGMDMLKDDEIYSQRSSNAQSKNI